MMCVCLFAPRSVLGFNPKLNSLVLTQAGGQGRLGEYTSMLYKDWSE